MLQIQDLNLDNCRATQIEGLTDEFTNLTTLSLINVGLTTLKGFPNLASLRKVSAVIFQRYHTHKHRCLPRDASAERGDATVSRLSVCLSVRNVQVPCSNTFEVFENNFTAE